MTDAVQLKEYEDWIGELTKEDVAFICRELSDKVTVGRHIRDDRYILNPKQFVGVVVLPSGRRMESYRKIPVQSLFYMLAVAFNFPPPFREESTEFARLEDILEFVASFFADLVEDRIDHGLYRSYVQREDNLAAIRGRISFPEDVRQNYILRHRTYCRYSEFTWDIPENQIVRQVAYLLSGWQFQKGLRLRLSRIDAALAEVMPTRLPASSIDNFHYHRLNDDYRQVHQLCRLFLEGSSLSEDIGPFDFRTFLLDMNKLFEEFVTQVLRNRARQRMRVSSQVPMFLGHDGKIRMRPDIVISSAGNVILVADCKYKRLEEDEFKNHDAYQLLAYCTSTCVQRGLLIYPTHSANARDQVSILNTPILVRQTTIDLSKEGDEFVSSCDAFADEVFAWAST